MAATNAPLAFGGMTQHCWRWGWRMFFLVPAQSSSRWRDRQFGVPQPFSPTAAGSSARAPLSQPASALLWGMSNRKAFAHPGPQVRLARQLEAAIPLPPALGQLLSPDRLVTARPNLRGSG